MNTPPRLIRLTDTIYVNPNEIVSVRSISDGAMAEVIMTTGIAYTSAVSFVEFISRVNSASIIKGN